jgi:hypothetical protein
MTIIERRIATAGATPAGAVDLTGGAAAGAARRAGADVTLEQMAGASVADGGISRDSAELDDPELQRAFEDAQGGAGPERFQRLFEHDWGLLARDFGWF